MQQQHDKLQEAHRQVVEKNAQVLAAQGESHQAALNLLEQQWNSRYEQDIAALNLQLQTLQQQHELALQQQQAESQQRLDALNQELKQEKSVKAALIARVRGVSHE